MRTLIIFCALLFLTACANNDSLVDERMDETRLDIKSADYQKLTLNLPYQDSIPEPEFKNLTMIGKVETFGVAGDDGRLLRSLRFKNITDAVEQRYNLPPNILLAMVAQESSGVDLLPNGLNDGGFGLCHMQPVVAQSFGLNVYERCKEMVCKKHGIKLKSILMENNNDRKTVITYDDRLHPIFNLDAVGRMLASYMSGKRISGLGPFRTAICRYAGKYNYEKYWQHVKRYMIKLEDQSYLQRLEESFNKLNPSFTIDGKKADFDLYIQVCQQQNYNYGLGTYKNLPKYLPRNSNKVLRTYKKFL